MWRLNPPAASPALVMKRVLANFLVWAVGHATGVAESVGVATGAVGAPTVGAAPVTAASLDLLLHPESASKMIGMMTNVFRSIQLPPKIMPLIRTISVRYSLRRTHRSLFLP